MTAIKLNLSNVTSPVVDGSFTLCVKVTTPTIGDDHAVTSVATVIENEGVNSITVQVLTEILDTNGCVIARDEAPVTIFAGKAATLRQRLYVKEPRLWSVEQPNLYTCRTIVTSGDEKLDEEITSFGIRSLTIDPWNGLCINGETVKLRGACIHHDNGVIGGATIDRAEERRVEILKEAGFNALRSAHHPMSKALLDACDRLGMLVMDESFDMWTFGKTDFDYALHFLFGGRRTFS